MNILILGYGKMGRAIEAIAINRGHTITHKATIEDQASIADLDTTDVDVAIEFTQPDAAVDNIKFCIDRGIPIVSGTTGWLSEKPSIDQYCNDKNGAFFYASNFSVGVNLFFKVNEFLAKLMNKYDQYAIGMEEIHHTEKKDAPSGTAITLAEGIINYVDRTKGWAGDRKEVGANEIPIDSLRIDKVPGTHTIKYSSSVDEIEIKHTAHSREGFAMGAVLVSEWIIDKKGSLSMDDFLKI
ncbi:MAG: 4-hydroxy-tetrahydrodipicolinate reductase [Bacteroidota bacterium]